MTKAATSEPDNINHQRVVVCRLVITFRQIYRDAAVCRVSQQVVFQRFRMYLNDLNSAFGSRKGMFWQFLLLNRIVGVVHRVHQQAAQQALLPSAPQLER